MTTYIHWTPWTDTTELAAWARGPEGYARTRPIPVIDGEVDETAEVPFPWGRPTVTRYETGRARWARRWARLRRSRFAADVRARWRTFLAALGFLAVALLLLRLQDAVHQLAPLTTGGWS